MRMGWKGEKRKNQHLCEPERGSWGILSPVFREKGLQVSDLSEPCRVLRTGPHSQPTPVARWGHLAHVFHRGHENPQDFGSL